IGLLRDMIGEPFVQANARQSGLHAIASVRATVQVMRGWKGQRLEFLQGIPDGRSDPVEGNPGAIPGAIPAKADWDTLNLNIRQFAPPRIGSAKDQPLPQINLDKVLQFLIA